MERKNREVCVRAARTPLGGTFHAAWRCPVGQCRIWAPMMGRGLTQWKRPAERERGEAEGPPARLAGGGAAHSRWSSSLLRGEARSLSSRKCAVRVRELGAGSVRACLTATWDCFGRRRQRKVGRTGSRVCEGGEPRRRSAASNSPLSHSEEQRARFLACVWHGNTVWDTGRPSLLHTQSSRYAQPGPAPPAGTCRGERIPPCCGGERVAPWARMRSTADPPHPRHTATPAGRRHRPFAPRPGFLSLAHMSGTAWRWG